MADRGIVGGYSVAVPPFEGATPTALDWSAGGEVYGSADWSVALGASPVGEGGGGPGPTPGAPNTGQLWPRWDYVPESV